MALTGISPRFSEKETIQFVELYEMSECLWNYKHPDYKNKFVRDNACAIIVQEMAIPGFGVPEVVKKIKSIRGTYSQEVMKETVKKIKSRLSWFHIADRFLRDIMIVGNPNFTSQTEDVDSPMECAITEEYVKEENFSNDEESEIVEQANSPKPSSPEVTNEHENQSVINQRGPRILRGTTINFRNKNKILASKNQPRFVRRRRFDYTKRLSDNIRTLADKKEDEFYYFGNNVASQLRQLPLDQALYCQTKIMEFLTQQRLTAMGNEFAMKNFANSLHFAEENVEINAGLENPLVSADSSPA